MSGSREFPLLSPILFPCSFFTPKIYAIILSIFFFAMNSFLNKKAFQYDAYHSLFTVQGCLCQGGLPDRDLLDMGPGTEIPLPRRNMGPGSQTGSGIIQRPPMNRHIPVKILPCPKLLLQAVKIFLGVGIPERWGSLCQIFLPLSTWGWVYRLLRKDGGPYARINLKSDNAIIHLTEKKTTALDTRHQIIKLNKKAFQCILVSRNQEIQ